MPRPCRCAAEDPTLVAAFLKALRKKNGIPDDMPLALASDEFHQVMGGEAGGGKFHQVMWEEARGGK